MKRKTGLAFLLLGLAMLSCKKEYTCDCAATAIDNNNNGSVVRISNTSKAYGKKLTKKQAKAACEHEESTIQSSAEGVFQNPMLAPYFNVSVSTDCTLK